MCCAVCVCMCVCLSQLQKLNCNSRNVIGKQQPKQTKKTTKKQQRPGPEPKEHRPLQHFNEWLGGPETSKLPQVSRAAKKAIRKTPNFTSAGPLAMRSKVKAVRKVRLIVKIKTQDKQFLNYRYQLVSIRRSYFFHWRQKGCAQCLAFYMVIRAFLALVTSLRSICFVFLISGNSTGFFFKEMTCMIRNMNTQFNYKVHISFSLITTLTLRWLPPIFASFPGSTSSPPSSFKW